jgi:hypothetical protein
MAGPWDFNLREFRPMSQGLQSGMNLGQGLLDARAQGVNIANAQRQAQQQALEFQQKQAAMAQAQEAAQLQAQQAAAARAEWGAMGDGATLRQMDDLIRRNPQALGVTGFKDAYDRQTTTEKQQAYADLAEPFAALQNGDVDTAIEVLDKQWAGYTNANDEKTARSRARLVEMAKVNPEAARRRMFAMLSSVADKDQRESLFALDNADVKLRKDTADADKAEEESRRAAETIEADLNLKGAQRAQYEAATKNFADRLGYDYWKAREDFALQRAKNEAANKANEIMGEKLSNKELEQQNKMSDEAAATLVMKKRASIIAARFRDPAVKNAWAGRLGTETEKVKAFLGFKDDVSEARAMYDAFKNEKVLEQLPPGAASDNDIKMMSQPFPAATDDPEYIARYMDKVVELTEKAYRIKSARAQWQANNHSLGAMRRDGAQIDLDGEQITIPNGMTYDSFVREMIDEGDE